jgi:hypothetical protein
MTQSRGEKGSILGRRLCSSLSQLRTIQGMSRCKRRKQAERWKVNKELQQDSLRDMDPSMGLSDEQDPVVEELQQALVLGGEQRRATASESESPMPAF